MVESYAQSFVMRWNGVKDGRTHPDFVHASLKEKKKVVAHFKGMAK